jgi:hypothetical protein
VPDVAVNKKDGQLDGERTGIWGCAASRWCNFSACADNLIATNSSANSANLLYGAPFWRESVAIFRLCSEIGHLRKQKSCFIV